jgi:glycosyltransferase involved in cell wall biosynthesis
MPSLWEETFGRTVTEAQLSGIPALASSRGNLVDTVGPGGLTVDAHAPLDAWVAALDRLWADDGGAFAAAARAHAWRPEADPAVIARRFLSLLSDYIAAQPPA